MFTSLQANLDRMGVPLREIRYGLATHYHIDHAGAAQDLKQRGMRLIVTPEQQAHIPLMRQWIKPGEPYTEITTHDNTQVPLDQSRAFLRDIGIDGEIVHTPGHSDDSVTLVLDTGAAFTGDLTMEAMVGAEDPSVIARSWQALRDRGVTTIYGGHGPIHPIPPPLDRG